MMTTSSRSPAYRQRRYLPPKRLACCPQHPTENGSALIVGLLLLFMATLIGFASVENSTMQSLYASNTQINHANFTETETMLKFAGGYTNASLTVTSGDPETATKALELNLAQRETSDDAETDADIVISAAVSTDYCGTIPSNQIRGININHDSMANAKTFAGYGINTQAITTVKKNADAPVQASATHDARIMLFMLAPQGEQIKSGC